MPSVTQARLMWRSVARSMVEPHPFARNPITMTPHAWRAADLSKKVVKTSTVQEKRKGPNSKEVEDLILNMRWDD
ncbi:unnamed protein product [Alternaria sp. RS040]